MSNEPLDMVEQTPGVWSIEDGRGKPWREIPYKTRRSVLLTAKPEIVAALVLDGHLDDLDTKVVEKRFEKSMLRSED